MPLVATKASTLPFTCELIEVMVSILKVEASGIASIIFYHSVVVAQSFDPRLSCNPCSREEQYEG